jgi:hypothetical protein
MGQRLLLPPPRPRTNEWPRRGGTPKRAPGGILSEAGTRAEDLCVDPWLASQGVRGAVRLPARARADSLWLSVGGASSLAPLTLLPISKSVVIRSLPLNDIAEPSRVRRGLPAVSSAEGWRVFFAHPSRNAVHLCAL